MKMSSPLRFKKFWLTVGWSLVIAVIVLSLMPPLTVQSVENVDKVGHLIAYFVLMGWFAQIYHTSQQRFYYMIRFILLGIVLEILQGLSGIRHFDWVDMLANSIGVLLAWQLTKNRFTYVLAYFEHLFRQLREKKIPKNLP